MFAACALALALTAPAAPPDDVNLAWKFKEGDVFYALSKNSITQTFTVMGRDITQTIDSETVMRYTIKSIKAGATVVEMTYMSNKTKAEGLPGADAADGKLKGVKLIATLNGKMEVAKLEGYDKVVNAIAGDDEQAKKATQTMLPEGAVKQMLNETFALVPGGTAKIGGTWTRKDAVPLAGIGDVSTATTYKLDKASDTVAAVSWTATGTFKAGDGDLPGIPVKLSKADLKIEKLTGSYSFDLTKGRLTESKSKMEMAGSMTFSANGMDVSMDVKQKMTQSSTVSDKNPTKD